VRNLIGSRSTLYYVPVPIVPSTKVGLVPSTKVGLSEHGEYREHRIGWLREAGSVVVCFFQNNLLVVDHKTWV